MSRVTEVTKADAKEEIASKLEEIPWQSPKRGVEYREQLKKKWLKENTDYITKWRQEKKKIRDSGENRTQTFYIWDSKYQQIQTPPTNKLKLGQTMFPVEAALAYFLQLGITKGVGARTVNIFMMVQLCPAKACLCPGLGHGNTKICAWKPPDHIKASEEKAVLKPLKYPIKP